MLRAGTRIFEPDYNTTLGGSQPARPSRASPPRTPAGGISLRSIPRQPDPRLRISPNWVSPNANFELRSFHPARTSDRATPVRRRGLAPNGPQDGWLARRSRPSKMQQPQNLVGNLPPRGRIAARAKARARSGFGKPSLAQAKHARGVRSPACNNSNSTVRSKAGSAAALPALGPSSKRSEDERAMKWTPPRTSGTCHTVMLRTCGHGAGFGGTLHRGYARWLQALRVDLLVGEVR